MNTYYIAGFPVNDELYHHGILGMKWGIRRYQNPDGTLTPAGKERYGSPKGQKEFARTVTRDSYDKLGKTPQVKHAVANLEERVKEERFARKRFDDECDKFYSDQKLVDEYTEKAANKFMKDYPGIAQEYKSSRSLSPKLKDLDDKDLIKWMFFNDDWGGEGDYDPLTVFEESGDKRASGLVEADRKFTDAQVELTRSAREYAKAFLGEYGSTVHGSSIPGWNQKIMRSVEATVTSVIQTEAHKKYDKLFD